MVNTPSPRLSAVSGLASSRREWAIAATFLALGLGLLAVIFRPEITAAVQVWIESTSFNHCFLVIPVALYLAWDRRDMATATLPQPEPRITLLAIPVVAVWLVADRLGFMEGRQLMAMACVQILFAAILGPRTWRALAVPLLYLFFLVPFGEFMIPPLQDFTARFMAIGLNLLHIPNFLNGVSVEIPEGTFYVSDLCSGFGFLNALAAFGVLYAFIMYTSPLRRLWFVALSLIVPIIANGFRALGIILIAHYIDDIKAIELDHVQWGWYFFSFIILILILIGLPFRQERRSAPARSPSPAPGPAKRTATVLALAPIILLAAAPRLLADRLNDLGAGATLAASIGSPALAGCTPAPMPTAPSDLPADDGLGVAHSSAYRCHGTPFVLTLYRYPPRISAHPLFVQLEAAVEPPGWKTAFPTGNLRVGNGPQAPVWQITEAERGNRAMVVASALWINGRPLAPGITARIDQALNTWRRSPLSPVLAVVTHPVGGNSGGPWRAMRSFLAKTTQLSGLISRWVVNRTS